MPKMSPAAKPDASTLASEVEGHKKATPPDDPDLLPPNDGKHPFDAASHKEEMARIEHDKDVRENQRKSKAKREDQKKRQADQGKKKEKEGAKKKNKKGASDSDSSDDESGEEWTSKKGKKRDSKAKTHKSREEKSKGTEKPTTKAAIPVVEPSPMEPRHDGRTMRTKKGRSKGEVFVDLGDEQLERKINLICRQLPTMTADGPSEEVIANAGTMAEVSRN